MISEVIQKLVQGNDLEENEVIEVMNSMMDGGVTQAQIGSFITALRIKGETTDEITGFARVMRDKAFRIYPRVGYCIDTCGTGGDGANTFNISTAAAFVAAAGGVAVAKHGNRSVSSNCGSADVLEALGVNILLSPDKVSECIEKTGIGFMFAPNFHNSMRFAAGPRKELGIRTVFNILGPLTNPADAKGQLLGVFDRSLTEKVANVIMKLGVERALVVHGLDGFDELTVTGPTFISEVKGGKISSYEVCPEDFGLLRSEQLALAGGDAHTNAEIIKRIFAGIKGPQRDVVLLNSAAALYVGKAVRSLKEGMDAAAQIIDAGKAMNKLEELIAFTKDVKDIQ